MRTAAAREPRRVANYRRGVGRQNNWKKSIFYRMQF